DRTSDPVGLTEATTYASLDTVRQVEQPRPEVRTAPATRLKRPLLMAASAVLLCIGIVALSSVWSKASPTVESKSPLPTHSATALPMPLAAATLAQRTILTTRAIASHTHTPSATSTPTPSDPATVVAIVTAHDTVSAIGSFTYTSTRTSTF